LTQVQARVAGSADPGARRR